MTTLTMPVQKDVIEVLENTPFHIEYAIEIFRGPLDPRTQIEIYRINNLSSTFFSEEFLDLVDMAIRLHASNVAKDSKETKAEAAGDEYRNN
jgi:hypothetical protein